LDRLNELLRSRIAALRKLSGRLSYDRLSAIAKTMCGFLRGDLGGFWLLNQGLACIVGMLSVLLSCLLVCNNKQFLIGWARVSGWGRPSRVPIVGQGFWIDNSVIDR